MLASIQPILDRCLAKDVDARYNHAREIATALRGTKLGETSRRSRAPWVVAAVAAVAVAAVLLSGDGSAPAGTPRIANPTLVTRAVGVEDHPAWSPDGETLAYSASTNPSWFSANWDVWVSQVCSEQPLNRTADHVGDDRFPSWSPDGSQIAFWSTRNDGGIYVMPALAGGARRLSGTASGPNRPQWSRDGQEIAYKVGNNIEILSVSTGDTHRIVPQHSQGIFDLAWSPDGRFFAFIHARGNLAAQVTQLVLLRVSDGKEFEITDGVTNVWSPAWRDGSRTLAYVSNRGGPRDLWIQRLKEDGEPASEPTQMTTGLEILSANFSVDGGRVAYSKGRYISNVWRVPILEDRVATWDDAERITHDQADVEFVDVSPDGTELAVSSDRSGEPNLWILPSSGGEMRSLTTDPTPDWQPDYSPDGKEILFYAFRSGNRDLWVVPAAGGAARQLTTHEARDSYPTWSPDGTRIAFDSERSGNADIWLLTVASGEIERLTTEPRGERHPTWSPDGEWVVFFSGGRPWRIPAHGGEPESLGTTSSGFGRFSPDGRSLYVSHIDNGAGNVWVIDPETKVERAVTKLEGRLGALGVRALATDGRYIYFTWRVDIGDVWVADVVDRKD